MLKNAPIVILDEPTAALDTESEVAVQSAIDALVRDRTVIVIAHRLSTIAAADRILVIDDGCLVEQGRHDDLLAREGRYASVWRAQQSAKNWHVLEPRIEGEDEPAQSRPPVTPDAVPPGWLGGS
jgi:ATP-binding cassette subfamily B protein